MKIFKIEVFFDVPKFNGMCDENILIFCRVFDLLKNELLS